jgi:hypothetical protein
MWSICSKRAAVPARIATWDALRSIMPELLRTSRGPVLESPGRRSDFGIGHCRNPAGGFYEADFS